MADVQEVSGIVAHIDGFGVFFTLAVGALLPLAALRTKRRIDKSDPRITRAKLIRSIVITQIFLAAFAFRAASRNDIDLLPARMPAWSSIAGPLILLVFMAATLPLKLKRSPKTMKRSLLLPTSPKDLPSWFMLSLLAGTCEEIIYRGALTELLAIWTGSFSLGALLSAVSFGLAHVVQGWNGVLITLVLAIGFQCSVEISGSLYVAMGTHFLYDCIVGVFWSRVKCPSAAFADATASSSPSSEA